MLTKLLTWLGLDPANMTFDALMQRGIEIALAHVNLASALALAGAAFYVTTLLMRTIVPLRVFGIIGDLCFIGYGLLAHSVTVFFMYVLLLPINAVRLRQMLKLIRKARTAAQGDLSMAWLAPYMTRRNYRKGAVLFRKGDIANEMFMAVTAEFRVVELDKTLPAGTMFGELGFLSKNNKRTQTVECTADGAVLTITYEKLLELYFQNPEFGYYFLRLTSDRLLENMAALEAQVARYKAATPEPKETRPSDDALTAAR
jgi:CRP-like cAMP-binding protein